MRRVRSAGMRKPEMITAFAKSRLDTSGCTFSLIKLSLTISGMNVRRMPNSRYWIVIVGAPLVLGWAIGIGISPPARKLAVSWLPANRLGSARILACPSVASASMNDEEALGAEVGEQRGEPGGRRIQDDVARDLVDRVVGVENAGPDASVPARIAIQEVHAELRRGRSSEPRRCEPRASRPSGRPANGPRCDSAAAARS